MYDNSIIKEQLLNTARKIGDNLLLKADKEFGYSWYTPQPGYTRHDFYYNKSEDINTGAYGIALFLLELYNNTKEQKYLDAVKGALQWGNIFELRNLSPFNSLYTGRCGSIFLCLRIFEITGEEIYLDGAIKTAKEIYIVPKDLISEFENGISGAILVLIRVFEKSGDKEIYAIIERLTMLLINNANITEDGIYWDRSYHNSTPLCGVAKGCSGIAFTLLELANFLDIDSLYTLAEKAISYEEKLYDPGKKNWSYNSINFYALQDYDTASKAYEKGNHNFFRRKKFHLGWQNGAAGIGMVRLRAAELLKKNKYKKEALASIDNCLTYLDSSINFSDYSLSTGIGGIGELLIKAGTGSKNKKLSSSIEKIAGQIEAIVSGDIHLIPDLSLMNGRAGMGYFLLRAAYPESTPSVLLPELKTQIKPEVKDSLTINLNNENIITTYLFKYFPRTLRLLDVIKIDFVKLNIIPEILLSDFHRSFIKKLESSIHVFSNAEQERIKEISDLEFKKVQYNTSHLNFAFNHIKYITEQLKNDSLKVDENLVELNLKLNSDTKLFITKWNWNIYSEEGLQNILKYEPEEYCFMVSIFDNDIIEQKISDFTYTIVEAFKSKKTFKNGMKEILKSFDKVSIQSKLLIEDKVLAQLKELISVGLILVENK